MFRADGLHQLSSADLATLAGIGLRTVVDLRTNVESEQRGRFPIDDLAVNYLALPLTDVLPAPDELPEWAKASHVASRYEAMVVDGGPVLSSAIRALSTNEALPAVVHCSAGKDRTGVLVALVLGFLGVADETIVDDYTLSAEAMERLLERLKAEYPDHVAEVERYAPAVLHVQAATMEEFLATIRSTYGTWEDLAVHLDVAGEVTRLRAALLVDV